MKTVLAISSQVVRGHVGLAAIKPALGALGIEVLAMPTVLISNHPGHKHGAGIAIEPGVLEEMADALDANGWLDEVDAVISGYLPSAAHVGVVRRLVQRLRGLRDIVYLCDPVIGDRPKGLYVPEDAAAAIRDELIGLADILTPNAFELEWLSGNPVTNEGEALRAAAALTCDGMVVATSVPADEAGGCAKLANIIIRNDKGWRSVTDKCEGVPQGTGDLFGALLLGHLLGGCDGVEAGGRATAGVRTVIEAGGGRDELNLTGMLDAAVNAIQDAEEIR